MLKNKWAKLHYIFIMLILIFLGVVICVFKNDAGSTIQYNFIAEEESNNLIEKTGNEIMKTMKNETFFKNLRETWTLKTWTAMDAAIIGDTILEATIPLSSDKIFGTINFTIPQNDITKITGYDVLNGISSSENYSYPGFTYEEKLSNGKIANYAYVVGVSTLKIYKYNVEITNTKGLILRNETFYGAVPDRNSIYLLKVSEGAVSLYIENAARNATKYFSSRSAYIDELTLGDDKEKNVSKCIFFE